MNRSDAINPVLPLILDMTILLRTVKLLILILHVLVGLIIAVIWLRGIDCTPPTRRQQKLISWWLRSAARVVGADIRTHGRPPDTTVLAVANHISWLDVLVIASVLPVSFVSKAEVRDWPLFGRLATRSGTLFIRRGGHNAANQATEQITWFLLRRQNILMFPEGTTSTGREVKHFHRRLFGAALRTGTPVLPIAICYPHPEGVNPVAPFTDGEPFINNALRVLGEKSIPVELTFCPLVVSDGSDRTVVAKRAHAAIEKIVMRNQTAERGARKT